MTDNQLKRYLEYFSKSIENQRVTKGLTKKQIADALNLTPSTLVKWENRKGFSTVESLIDLCLYFQVTPNDILGFTESKESTESKICEATESPPKIGVTEGVNEKNKDPVKEALREIVREELNKLLNK